MKIKNSTYLADAFIRKAAVWICREIGLPVRAIRVVAVRYGKGGGLAKRVARYVGVRVRKEEAAFGGFRYGGAQMEVANDRIEWFVAILAHELTHHFQWQNGFEKSELVCVQMQNLVMKAFRVDRDRLMGEWNREESKPIKPVVSAVEKRFAKVVNSLARWERKLKLAKTKVRKLKTRVAYYERKAAMKTQ